jgi:hypothetical protein
LIAYLLAASPGLPEHCSDQQLAEQAAVAYRHGLQTQANAFQSRQAFARAAQLYDLLRRRGIDNPALERNLGQAHLLAGDLPHAIVAFRRGLAIDPNDFDLADLLEAARDRVIYTTTGPFGRPPADDWPPWLPRPGPRTLLWWLLILHTLACIALTRWWMTRQSWLMTLASSLFSSAVFVGVCLYLDERQRQSDQTHPVVVIAADRVMLHKGNGARYPWYDASAGAWQEGSGTIPPDAPALNRGVEARLRFDKGDWVQIELTGGEIGWVRRGEVVIDCDD